MLGADAIAEPAAARPATRGRPPLLVVRVAMVPFEALSALEAPAVAAEAERLALDEDVRRAEAERLSVELYDLAGPREDGPETPTRAPLLALRRAIHNHREPSPESLEALDAAAPPALARRVRRHLDDARRARDGLRLFRDTFRAGRDRAKEALAATPATWPVLEEGVWLASRALAERAHTLADDPPGGWTHGQRHGAAKLLSYLARAATKTSPAGVFAATALGAWAETAHVDGENTIGRIDLLLSVAEARKVTAHLAIDPSLRSAIVPRPNPTLREDPAGWTFWRTATARRPADDETLTRIGPHPGVHAFLEEARGGRNAHAVVAGAAAHWAGDAPALFDALVARGILIAEIEIPYTSRRPLADLAAAARRADAHPDWLLAVEDVEADIARAAGEAPARRRQRLAAAAARLEALPHTRPLSHDELFRVDAATAMGVTLPPDVIPELRSALRWYARLYAALYPEGLVHASYAARFLERFSAGSDVPLLDLYHGVFEPRAARRPVGFVDPTRVARNVPSLAAARDRFARLTDLFARAAHDAERDGVDEVDLAPLCAEDATWREMAREPEPVVSAGVLFQVAARDAAAVTSGTYRLCLNGLYPGAGLSVARLAALHGGEGAADDNPIVREVREGWSWLERPGAVLAELTFNHGGRTANAGLRPPIFRYEIELPGDTASPGVEVIPLSDLVVQYDAARERFALRSRARNVEVLPILSSGVNPEGIVAFLLAIGQQGVQPLGYLPGFDVDGVRAWPRFTLGRVVVFRRRWVFRGSDVPAAQVAGDDGAEADAFVALARWRAAHGIPRRAFAHTQAEPKPVYVDFESPLFADLLRRALRAAAPDPVLYVTEMLPSADEMWVRDARGRYAAEFLVHFTHPASPAPPPTA